MSVCSSLTQGILAFNISDLVPNGFINAVDTDRKNKTVKMLPSDRISVELQYTVTANTGTTLNDLAGGNTGGLGGLGGGAGSAIGQSIGASLQGDFEPTQSQFIFHVCDSTTILNKEIILTEEMISSGIIHDNSYIIGVFSITREKIEFTQEQINSFGRAGSELNGASPDINGLIQTENFVENNLFIEIIRDERKIIYRADNYIGGNCFVNSSRDDLTDKNIRFKSKFKKEDNQKDFVPGDKLYISYIISSKEILRHAIYVSSFFYLFPGPYAARIGQDRIKSWNFKPFSFLVFKNKSDVLPSPYDIRSYENDYLFYEQKLSDKSLSDSQRLSLEKEKNSKLLMEKIECQRLTQSFWDSGLNTPYIKGFYIADKRGIFKVSVDNGYSADIIIESSKIRDQSWWTSFITDFINNNYGFTNGEIDFSNIESLKSVLQKGFLFDISDHVNSCLDDNKKFGYQKDLAEALLKISSFINKDNSGLGCSNLDFESNNVKGKELYDGSSVKFDFNKMSSILSGAYFVRDCNVIFNQENLFNQGSSFLQADMFIRTPIFFNKLSSKSRIYMERFSPYLSLSPDGGIWVTTNAVSGDSISSDVNQNKKTGIVVFTETSSQTLNYHILDDGIFRYDFENLKEKITNNHNKKEVENVSYLDIKLIGYDKILGNVPGYSLGMEITKEMGKFDRNLNKEFYSNSVLPFVVSGNDVIVGGISDKRIKSLKLYYKYIKEPQQKDEVSLFIVFPNKKAIIDNIILNKYQFDSDELYISFNVGYYNDNSFVIKGEGLKFVKITKIEAVFLKEDSYSLNKVYAGVSSAVIDSNGNWYVFYEDNQVSFEEYNTYNSSINEEGNFLSDSSFLEISCLVSYDNGETWYDFKGIVRTASNEVIRYPYAVIDKNNNVVNLFYIINDCLCHTSFSVKLFNKADSFIRYRRPLKIGYNTSDDFGIDFFSQDGRSMRKSISNIIVGDINSDFLSSEIDISKNRIKNNLNPRFRVVSSNNLYNEKYDSNFIYDFYSAMIDRQNNLKIFYCQNNKMFMKSSYTGGIDWNSFGIDGFDFHKYNNNSESSNIRFLSCIYKEKNDYVQFAYIVDDILVVKFIHNDILSSNDKDVLSKIYSLDFENIFVVGSIDQKIKQQILSDDSFLLFPYYENYIDYFNENFGIQISNISGFCFSSGFDRFFYRNSNGYVSAFTLTSASPVLDSRLSYE